MILAVFFLSQFSPTFLYISRGHCGRDRMVVGFSLSLQSVPITTNVVSSNPCSWWSVLDTTLCDNVCQWLATAWWFSLGTPVSSNKKIDHHNITDHEILLKVALNTTTQTMHGCRPGLNKVRQRGFWGQSPH